jgi:IclR family transcriptional regulator, acetate operon repressor
MSRRIHGNVASVVEVLADRGRLSVAFVAQEVELPRASVQRIADGLVAADLAEVGQDGRVALTTRWLHLAETFRRTGRGWPGAHDLLQTLAARTGLTAHLLVPEADLVLCVDRAPARGTDGLEPRPGGTLPLFAGAGGRLVLAHTDREEYLARAPFDPLTPAGLVTAAQLRADRDRILADGHVLAAEDVVVGVAGLGAPLVADGVFLGALTLGGPVAQVTGRRAEHLDVLLAAAEVVARHYRT